MAADDEVLSQAEVDALVKGVHSGAVETLGGLAAPGEARAYDFSAQVQLSRGRMPTLERINERFGQLFRKSLFTLLRKSADVVVTPLQVKKFGDYVNTLTTPISVNLVRVNPLRGTGLVVIDPKLVFAVVDSFFGGSGRAAVMVEGREFTATEIRIVHLLLKHVFHDVRDAWGNVHPIEMEYVNSETNPHFANVVGPNEIVVVTNVHVELEGGGGDLHITLPYSMLEPLRELLDSGMQADQFVQDERWVSSVREELEDAEVELSAMLGTAIVTVSELVNLKPGDILPCDFAGKATIYADEVPLFRGNFGVSRGQQSVKYETRIARSRNEKVKA